MLGRAFANDLIVRWPLGDVDGIEQRITSSFRLLDYGCAAAGLLIQSEDSSGAALWVGPKALERFSKIELASRDTVRALTSDGGARYDEFWDWIEAQIPDEPVWFLDHVGVEPDRQGRGIGAALISWGLANARRDGIGAFLETATEANVAYYETFGFRVDVEVDAPSGGPHIWFMSSRAQ